MLYVAVVVVISDIPDIFLYSLPTLYLPIIFHTFVYSKRIYHSNEKQPINAMKKSYFQNEGLWLDHICIEILNNMKIKNVYVE